MTLPLPRASPRHVLTGWLERPAAVPSNADAHRRVGAIALPGCRLDPERRARFEVVLAAGGVARDVSARRHHDALLAVGILDQEAWIATVGGSRAHDDRLHEAVGHGAVRCAVPSGVVVAAVGLRPREDVHLHRFLTSVS